MLETISSFLEKLRSMANVYGMFNFTANMFFLGIWMEIISQGSQERILRV